VDLGLHIGESSCVTLCDTVYVCVCAAAAAAGPAVHAGVADLASIVERRPTQHGRTAWLGWQG
jgi:hypothetical protein